MFIKTTRSGKYEYLQIVETVRENGRVTHKVRFNLGRKDAIVNSPEWQTLAAKLAVLTGLERPAEKKKSPLEGLDLSEGTVLNWGHVIYRKLWDSLGLAEEIQLIQNKTKAQFSLDDAVFLMALHHLLSPGSKLNCFEHQERYTGLSEVELQNLYRALDILCLHKENLEDNLFARNYSLMDAALDIVFYDVTTFAFESAQNDALRDFGFSKDNKFNEVQVVLGMFIDSDGCPVGYELFPCNTFDGKTLVKALASLKRRFGIRRVIVVADRGINSKLNLKVIKDAGYGYIVASRLKSMPAEVKEFALDRTGYAPLVVDTDTGEITVHIKCLDYTNVIRGEKSRIIDRLEERLIITHSVRRARKDVADRERLREKALRLLDSPETIRSGQKRGGKKYIRTEQSEETHYSLDEQALERDAAWDGFYAIQTSDKDISAHQILDAYHTLWKIEESFRIMKSALEVRPVYHWTPDRIRGHFVVCFLAFLLERKLEQRLHNNRVKEISPLRIREALNGLTVTQTTLNDEVIYLKSKVPALAGEILRILRIKQPATITAEPAWNTWLRSL